MYVMEKLESINNCYDAQVLYGVQIELLEVPTKRYERFGEVGLGHSSVRY